MWIDNLAAKYGLQKSYSKVSDSGRIINAFAIKQAALGMRIWFEWIPSEQNISDLPSRNKLHELEEVFEAVSRAGCHTANESDGEWTCKVYDTCKVRDFSTWRAPFVGRERKRARHGSRGAKRRKSL